MRITTKSIKGQYSINFYISSLGSQSSKGIYLLTSRRNKHPKKKKKKAEEINNCQH
jgi:hypothetical protein